MHYFVVTVIRSFDLLWKRAGQAHEHVKRSVIPFPDPTSLGPRSLALGSSRVVGAALHCTLVMHHEFIDACHFPRGSAFCSMHYSTVTHARSAVELSWT